MPREGCLIEPSIIVNWKSSLHNHLRGEGTGVFYYNIMT